MKAITDKSNNSHYFRKLTESDAILLGNYFESLSAETRLRFGPHPLTSQYAQHLCTLTNDTAQRFIVIENGGSRIIAYFILDFKMSEHEKARYAQFDIQLCDDLDVLFAPSVADDYQNKGIASDAMKLIIEEACTLNARSLVLMGGTQETNARAIAFYEKFGFKRFGGYQTDMFNHDMRVFL